MSSEPVPRSELARVRELTELTGTCLFRTREDGRGVLQIVGTSTNPPGVKIRYQLVETPETR